MNHVITEFLLVVDEIHGAYLDAVTGFAHLVDEYDKKRNHIQGLRPDIPSEAFDGAPMQYRTGLPGRPQSQDIHNCTQGEYRMRNAPYGRNHVVIGQMCIAQIYGYWEDYYREKLAKVAGLREKNDVKLDIMGDLRNLRISIIHHRGVALKEVEKCNLLKWFRKGEVMLLTPKHFEELLPALRSALTHWAANAGTDGHSDSASVAATGQKQ